MKPEPFLPFVPAPKTSRASLDIDAARRLQEVLKEAGQWVKAKDLHASMGLTDRALRNLAEASEGAVISGQLGYKHADCATAEEITHAANWLMAQGRKMMDRGLKILRRAHKQLASGG